MPATDVVPRNGCRYLQSVFSGLVALMIMVCPDIHAQESNFPLTARRILFLGDSITHAGGYVNLIETQLRLQHVDPLPEFINVGLSSETCSGLSEPDHPFPRPDVHERLDRALAAVKPDVVVACYGMNDGIYHPLSDERFNAYKDGISRLIRKVHASGARLVLMTPPPFDAVPLMKSGKLLPAGEEKYAYFAVYEDYDSVIRSYGEWILQQSDRVEMVVDLHTPITDFLAAKRKADPGFTAAPDGVHPNEAGHEILARVILKSWGIEIWSEPSPELLGLMNQRGSLLHDAWLSHVGHKRPGVKAGLPLDEARAKAAALLAQAQKLIDAAR